ncbi:MAG TPA: protein kinase, partial [Microthrixaceae bacterium]|nr:protein kinase [Microthrixaceae bacterium]
MEHLRPSNLPSGIRLIEVVGRGGSAVVWRARDRRAGRDVAVKVIGLPPDGPPRERTRDRFERELRALARLRHDHVLAVSAAGTDRDCCWVLTPLADDSLAGRTDRAPITDPDELCELALAVGSALAAAHRLDVVHGDVTPANVLFCDGRPVLADFGIAVLDAGAGTGPGWPATPGWAAPERLDGAEPTAA